VQEQDIIELLLQRNEKGMDALLLHYGPLMRYIIAPILQNSQDQEDCLSEVAMRVWKKIEQFNQERGSWKTWLTAITRNAALNYTRDTHRHNSVEEIPDDTPSPEPSPEEMIIQKERQTSVYKGYKQDKIEMRGDRAEMSDFPLYLNTVAGGLDRRDQTIGGFSFVVKIYAVPVVEIIG
jgi:RNA polymerase sigma factor (sigma-70 family)